MTSHPFMALYVGDYLADTLHLSTEQHGAYLLLLMTMWRADARLPNDPVKLARIARVSPSRWPRVWPGIAEFFTVDGDSIVNARLSAEYEKAFLLSQKRKSIGKRGGDANALKYKETGQAIASAWLNHSQSESHKEDADDSAGANFAGNPEGKSTAVEPTLRERVLVAAGVDPVSGLTGFGGSRLGTQADMAEVAKWTALGLSEAEIVAEVASVSARKSGGPPSRLSYFSKAMADLAAAKARPVPEGTAAPAVARRNSSDDLTKRVFARILAEKGAAQ